MSKHAPGPWRFTPSLYYQPGGIAPEIFDANNLVVARAYAWYPKAKGGAALTEDQKRQRTDLGLANARLISKAPNLLILLREIVSGNWTNETLASAAKEIEYIDGSHACDGHCDHDGAYSE